MKKLTNINIVLEDKVIFGDISFTNKIITITKKGEFNEEADILLAGFIDNHIHGAAGYDVMDGSIEAITEMSKALLKEGTTSYLPTTITQSEENISKALKNINNYTNNFNNYARVVGIHLEGPFINPIKKGAQPEKYIIKPNIDIFNKWLIDSGNLIKKVSYAPEMDDDNNFARFLKELNIIPSIAHSNATFSDVYMASLNGATSITHMYNALSPFHHRDIGAIGAGLLIDSLNTELILDYIHVSKEAFKLLLKVKTPEKIIIITDSMRAKGLSDGKSELGGQEVYIKNGMATLKDGTLAGSILKMKDAFKHLLEVTNSLVDVSKMMSLNASKELKLDDVIGSIKVNKDADFVLFDKKYNLIKTIVKGETLYEEQ